MKNNTALAHAYLPDLVIEGCVFEIVTEEINEIEIPEYVLNAFQLPLSKRNFNYTNALFPDKSFVNQWGPNSSVPDYTQLETKLWSYYVASRYLNAGAESMAGAING